MARIKLYSTDPSEILPKGMLFNKCGQKYAMFGAK